MATDTPVRAHMDRHLKEGASLVLAAMGLSMPDAIQLLLVRIASHKAVPFEVKLPDATTIATVLSFIGASASLAGG